MNSTGFGKSGSGWKELLAARLWRKLREIARDG
jgi:hypothetical protein